MTPFHLPTFLNNLPYSIVHAVGLLGCIYVLGTLYVYGRRDVERRTYYAYVLAVLIYNLTNLGDLLSRSFGIIALPLLKTNDLVLMAIPFLVLHLGLRFPRTVAGRSFSIVLIASYAAMGIMMVLGLSEAYVGNRRLTFDRAANMFQYERDYGPLFTPINVVMFVVGIIAALMIIARARRLGDSAERVQVLHLLAGVSLTLVTMAFGYILMPAILGGVEFQIIGDLGFMAIPALLAISARSDGLIRARRTLAASAVLAGSLILLMLLLAVFLWVATLPGIHLTIGEMIAFGTVTALGITILGYTTAPAIVAFLGSRYANPDGLIREAVVALADIAAPGDALQWVADFMNRHAPRLGLIIAARDPATGQMIVRTSRDIAPAVVDAIGRSATKGAISMSENDVSPGKLMPVQMVLPVALAKALEHAGVERIQLMRTGAHKANEGFGIIGISPGSDVPLKPSDVSFFQDFGRALSGPLFGIIGQSERTSLAPRQGQTHLALDITQGEEGSLDDYIMGSSAMTEILHLASRVADSNANILLLGETGTGKGRLARYIHSHSNRRERPFLSVNCGALPEGLIEAELFGYEKGAFTGASRTHAGYFERAAEGTLFLDEIGDAPAAVQLKILQAVQEKRITRVGGAQEILVNARLIFATHRDVERYSEENPFRRDLFYRIQALTIRLPALRDRKADIPILASRFAQAAARENKRTIRSISEDMLQSLLRYSWPGNIRELESVILRSVILAETDTLAANDLPRDLVTYTEARAGGVPTATDIENAVLKGGDKPLNLNSLLQDYEYRILTFALRKFGGNKSKAAEYLGLKRTSFVRKLERVKRD